MTSPVVFPSLSAYPYPSQQKQLNVQWPPVQTNPAPWSPTAALGAPVQAVSDNVKHELQKMFPGNYAHVIGWQPVKGTIRNLKQSGHMLNDVSHHRPVKDHELITLDDNMKRGASLGIATLATLGLSKKIFGVSEYLGFLSWFGAMAATPQIVNGMIHLKTGVNLNQTYDSTYGQRLNLYKDPNYLPLHILTDEQVENVANRLKIPEGPNRRKETEEKMRQISVQGHTWWMLMAGPATPVLSGLACDRLQDPAIRAVNAVKRKIAIMEANRGLGAKQTDVETLTRRSKVHLQQVIGDVPESELSSWWKQFGKGVVKQAGLDKAMPTSIITKGNRTTQVEKLVDYLAELATPENSRVKKTLEFLNGQYQKTKDASQQKGQTIQSGKLFDLGKKAEGVLAAFEEQISPAAYREQQQLLESRVLNAQSTVNHYRRLFEMIENAGKQNLNGDQLKRKIKEALTEPNINTVQDLLTTNYEKARELVGDVDTFEKISAALKDENRAFSRAFNIMGASPEAHLLDNALKSMKLGNMWRKRMGLYVGGGLLAATSLYTFAFVGKDFKKPVKKPTGGQA